MRQWIDRLLGVTLPTSNQILATEKEREDKLYETLSKKQQEQTPLGALNFILTKEGDIHVQCEWDDSKPSKEIGEIYAQLLYHVCAGHFTNTIKQILYEQTSRNVELQPCVKSIMKEWKRLREDQDDKPIIHPLRVFGMTDSIRHSHGPMSDDDSGEDIEETTED